jgi:hypothetical protein
MPSSPIGVITSFSIARNQEAIFYNPANFIAKENFELWCFYNRMYLSMHSVSFALGKKIKAVDFGLAVTNFDYGEIEWHPDYPTEDSLTSYNANDFSLIISGGLNLSPDGRIGINLKYISEYIYIYSDYALAIDLSISYSKSNYGLSFGGSNFGTQITLNNEEVNLPARVSLGGFYIVRNITMGLDLHYLINNTVFEFGFGLGLPINESIVLNAAANYRESLYPGFGIQLNTGTLGIKYGAAFYPKDLGMINIVGIGLGF